MLKTVTLPEEALPGIEYSLMQSEELILALHSSYVSDTPYTTLYFTDSGRVCLANLTLFDRQGNLIRQYPQSTVYTYDEHHRMVYQLPCPEGETVTDVYGLSDSTFHWLDGHTAILDCHAWIVLYDFAADSGRILDDMSGIVKRHGRFGIYYGSREGGVLGNTYYYLTCRQEDLTSGYTLWAADASGARKLFNGQTFWHLFAAKDGLVLASTIDPTNPESDSRVWYLGTGSTQLREIWTGDPALPFTEADQIAFTCRGRPGDSTVLCSYDPATDTLSSRDLGEYVQVDALFTLVRDGSLRYCYSQFKDGECNNWVYDTATDTTMPLTGFNGSLDISRARLSPDGQHYIEQDPSTEEPRLRVSLLEP